MLGHLHVVRPITLSLPVSFVILTGGNRGKHCEWEVNTVEQAATAEVNRGWF